MSASRTSRSTSPSTTSSHSSAPRRRRHRLPPHLQRPHPRDRYPVLPARHQQDPQPPRTRRHCASPVGSASGRLSPCASRSQCDGADAAIAGADHPATMPWSCLPGGVANPDQLQTVPEAVEFVQAMFRVGKPATVICHGPWTLLEADLDRGRRLSQSADRHPQRRRRLLTPRSSAAPPARTCSSRAASPTICRCSVASSSRSLREHATGRRFERRARNAARARRRSPLAAAGVWRRQRRRRVWSASTGNASAGANIRQNRPNACELA